MKDRDLHNKIGCLSYRMCVQLWSFASKWWNPSSKVGVISLFSFCQRYQVFPCHFFYILNLSKYEHRIVITWPFASISVPLLWITFHPVTLQSELNPCYLYGEELLKLLLVFILYMHQANQAHNCLRCYCGWRKGFGHVMITTLY